MLTKITIGTGHGLDKAGKALIDQAVALAKAAIIDDALALFGGVTITETTGAWKGEGQTFVEPGWSIVVLTDAGKAERHARTLAEFVKWALDQKAVYMTLEEVEGELV